MASNRKNKPSTRPKKNHTLNLSIKPTHSKLTKTTGSNEIKSLDNMSFTYTKNGMLETSLKGFGLKKKSVKPSADKVRVQQLEAQVRQLQDQLSLKDDQL